MCTTLQRFPLSPRLFTGDSFRLLLDNGFFLVEEAEWLHIVKHLSVSFLAFTILQAAVGLVALFWDKVVAMYLVEARFRLTLHRKT